MTYDPKIEQDLRAVEARVDRLEERFSSVQHSGSVRLQIAGYSLEPDKCIEGADLSGTYTSYRIHMRTDTFAHVRNEIVKGLDAEFFSDENLEHAGRLEEVWQDHYSPTHWWAKVRTR